MIFRHVDRFAIEGAAYAIGARVVSQSTDPWRLVLRPRPECIFRRVSAGYMRQRIRRVNAVCWHGHREFFRALFTLAPAAVVTTSLAKYTAANFEATYASTDRYIGLLVAPLLYSEACSCPEGAFPARREPSAAEAVARTEARRGETWRA